MTLQERTEAALRDLLNKAGLVQQDINDTQTGWYYQFGSSIDKAARVVRELDEAKQID